MNVKKLVVGDLKTNCYFIIDNNNNSLIIDPGADYKKIKDFIDHNNLSVLGILLTHGHYDHIGACYNLQKDGIKITIHQDDADKCANNNLNLANQFADYEVKTFIADILLDGNDGEFAIENFKIKYIHTPGHSAGGCCFVIDKYIFTGDTIFDYGYGRTDFYDGSAMLLRQSIRKILPYIQDGYLLLAGH